MAHYAFLNENNVVTEVIVGIDENELIEGLIPEQWYGEFRGQKCVRTSYNAATNGFRKNFASKGFTYDEAFNAFVPPRLYPSWKLNYTTFVWEPPIEMPERVPNTVWQWSEPNQEWIQIQLPQD